MTKLDDTSRWFRRSRASCSSRFRLFCFPYAGGSATVFHSWAKHAERCGVEVCAVQYPGREERISESPVDSLEIMVDGLFEAMTPLLEECPYGFFGHSMGTILCYELAARIEREGGMRLPAHVFVSAYRAPQRPMTRPPSHRLSDDALAAEVRAMGGTSDIVLENPELWSIYVPSIRSDLTIAERYLVPDPEKISAQVTAFSASLDHRVAVDDVAAWREICQAPDDFEHCRIDGGHFFLRDQERELVDMVTERLCRSAEVARRGDERRRNEASSYGAGPRSRGFSRSESSS